MINDVGAGALKAKLRIFAELRIYTELRIYVDLLSYQKLNKLD